MLLLVILGHTPLHLIPKEQCLKLSQNSSAGDFTPRVVTYFFALEQQFPKCLGSIVSDHFISIVIPLIPVSAVSSSTSFEDRAHFESLIVHIVDVRSVREGFFHVC